VLDDNGVVGYFDRQGGGVGESVTLAIIRDQSLYMGSYADTPKIVSLSKR
jgi:hypothetical protein